MFYSSLLFTASTSQNVLIVFFLGHQISGKRCASKLRRALCVGYGDIVSIFPSAKALSLASLSSRWC
jgi:hypothetical protein